MITLKHWQTFGLAARRVLLPAYTFIPRNRYGIRTGYYHLSELLELIRKNKKRLDVVKYIDDMLE